MFASNDFEHIFRLPTGPIRVVVVSEESEQLDPTVRVQTGVGEWINLLVTAPAREVCDFRDDDPLALARLICDATVKYFPSKPGAPVLKQFEDGLMEWIAQHRRAARAKNTAS